MKKYFVNMHALTSHPPSNLNRGDDGCPKTATFGGGERGRISSQCSKRALRFSDYYSNEIGDRSTRSKLVIEEIARELEDEMDIDVETINRYSLILAAVLEGKSKTKEVLGKKLSKREKIETQVNAYSKRELKSLKEILKKAILEMIPERKEKKSPIKDFFKKELEEIKKDLNVNLEVDLALSGRMAPCFEFGRIDASFAVAHPITTHIIESDLDWFTAVDDLNDKGSAYLDSHELISGVFYKYINFNLKQYQENKSVNRRGALDMAVHLLYMLATVVPTGKQNSSAAFNFAEYVLVTLSDQPISLVNAFESPVIPDKQGGLIKPSIEKLVNYQKNIFKGYNLDDEWASFSINDVVKIENRKESLNDLKEWLISDGQNV